MYVKLKAKMAHGDVSDVVAMVIEKLGTLCINGFCSPAVGRGLVQETIQEHTKMICVLKSPPPHLTRARWDLLHSMAITQQSSLEESLLSGTVSGDL